MRRILPLLALVACRPAPAPPAAWTDADGYRWRPLLAAGDGQPGFTSIGGTSSGIRFQNSVTDSAARENRILVQGAGVATGDVDGDGRADIFFGATQGKSALYLNRGGFRFEDATTGAGLALADRAVTGVVLADADGDADLDLFVNALGGPNGLFRNDGKARFTEDSSYPGRQSRLGSTTSTLADIDGDGDLDVYTANYKAYTTLDRLTPQERAFDQIVRKVGDRQFEVGERYRKDYKTILRDDLRAVSLVQRADTDFVFLNDGSGRYSSAPMAGPRWLDEAGTPVGAPGEFFSLAARFYDVDGDGDQDLYVANDFEDPDQFWLNDGRGTFRLIARTAVRATSNSGMAVDFGDIDRDGHPDLFEVDMLSPNSGRFKSQIPTHTVLPKVPGVYTDRPQMQRNTLFLNRGDATFAQIAEFAQVDASEWSWATMFLDVDLDGFEDLLVATGHPWDLMDADTEQKLKNRLSDVAWKSEREAYPKLALPNVAFRNRGDLTFETVSDRWRFAAGPDISHGMATADLDLDGDLDVVVSRLGAPPLLLRNDATGGRVSVRLLGRAPNTTGVGALVRVTAGGLPPQARQVTAGGVYLSGSDAELTFATGSADSVTIEVRWPDGQRTALSGVAPNRAYLIDRSGAMPAAPPIPPPSPLFVDASPTLDHRHLESNFDESSRQAILPNAFSQMGPGVSWLDLDHDGDDDLLIGAARGSALAWYRNERGRFSPVTISLPMAGDVTTMLTAPASRGVTLLVGQSSDELANPAQALALPPVLTIGLDPAGRPSDLPGSAAPPDTASVGPLAMADYDGDGDLDLFSGGRLIPGAYPVSPSSRLLLNDGSGRFLLDGNNNPKLAHLGMVSSALFLDADDDGDPDLLLAFEWGPLKLLLNQAGRFIQADKTAGFDGRYSRWFGMASGDLNEDGLLDIVATSWGQNVRPRVDSLHPLLLAWGQFNDDQVFDLVLAQRDDRINAVAPLVNYARLTRAFPGVAERVRTFTAYGDATLDQVLGAGAKSAFTFGATSLEHVVWMNQGAGRFEAQPLPAEAQLAPSVSPVVGEFNGDGHTDVFLSQNFFPTELNTPRYDAGRSLLLLGDGSGRLTPVPGQASGLLVYGDQRGAATADYDGDGRADLVVTQNGAETRLFRNRGAAPGIRVRLVGPPENPAGIGAKLWLTMGGKRGPAHEIHAGSGFWSHSSVQPVLGRISTGEATVEVRWPNGASTSTKVPPGAVTATIAAPR